MKVWYDREGDVLELVFEETPASMKEISEDIFERRPLTSRVIRFAVLNFGQHNHENITLPFTITATTSNG